MDKSWTQKRIKEENHTTGRQDTSNEGENDIHKTAGRKQGSTRGKEQRKT